MFSHIRVFIFMAIKYINKIVAFIDVLGFKNLIFSEQTKAIEDYYNVLLTDFKDAAVRNHLDFLLISDSIVVFTPFEKENLKILTRVLYNLQNKLLLKGILCRGGLSFGQLYVHKKNNIIVGKGLVNAYKLESYAVYPRIILDRALIDVFFNDSDEFLKELDGTVKLVPPLPYIQDFPYIDYPRNLSFTNQPSRTRAVLNYLKKSYYNNDYINKYEWLRSHIDISIRNRLDFMNNFPTQSKKVKYKIRVLNDFLKEFEKL